MVLSTGELRAQPEESLEVYRPLWVEGDTLIDEWRVDALESHHEFLRYEFRRGSGDTSDTAYVEINYRTGSTAQFTTDRFQVQPAPKGFAPPEVVEAVLRGLGAAEKNTERAILEPAPPPRYVPGSSLLALEEAQSSGERPTSKREHQSAEVRHLRRVHRGLRYLLLFAFVAASGGILGCRKAIPWRRHAGVVFALTALGAGARLATGVRAPGFEGGRGHAHGFGVLRGLLRDGSSQLDSHGEGQLVLAELARSFLPSTEASVLALQTALSIAAVPLVYFGAMNWLRSRRHAVCATTIYALLPSVVYFAQTEVRLVPGAFFVAASIALGGGGLALGSSLLWLAGGLLSVMATQCHPVLLFAPLVLGLLLLARRDRWPHLPRWPLLGASVVILVAYAAALSLIWAQVQSGGESIIGNNHPKVLKVALKTLRPTFTLSNKAFAAFLNAQTTPLILSLCWFYGLAQVRCPKWRWTVLSLSLAAIGMTLPGIAGGRYNLARLQLGAAPFHVMLATIGLYAAWTRFSLSRFGTRLQKRASSAFGLVILLLLLIPGLVGQELVLGPLGQSFVFAGERRVFLRALPKLTEDCDFWVAPSDDRPYYGAPSYLTSSRQPRSQWYALGPSDDIPKAIADSLNLGRCAYYYRSATCFAVDQNEADRETLLRSECAALEGALQLTPIHVERISATPSAGASYSADAVDVGVFRVESVRKAQPPE